MKSKTTSLLLGSDVKRLFIPYRCQKATERAKTTNKNIQVYAYFFNVFKRELKKETTRKL